MREFKFTVDFCGGSSGGTISVKAKDEESAYNKAVELVGRKLYKAFPSLEIDYLVNSYNEFIYSPRMEVTKKGDTKHSWNHWGEFDNEDEAIEFTKGLLSFIKAGKYDDRITEAEKANGYFLNACVEVICAESFDPLEIIDVD